MLTSPLEEWRIPKFVGMNNKVEDNDLTLEHSILTQNARFENEPGALVKRQPVAFYNPTEMVAGEAVHSSFRMYTTTGETKLIAICDDTLYVGEDTTGTMTAMKTGLTVKKATFLTYQNRCLISNGYDNILVYDGSSDNVVWELGSCKALTGGAGSITRTSISYIVTIDGDAYCCGAISNEIASVTAEDIELSNIPVGPLGTVDRKIYRKSDETGGVYRLIATIADNSTTTYSDSTADASAGAAYPGDTDDMVKGNLIQIHRERFFVSGDPDEPNKIYYSDPYLPHYIQHITLNRFLDVFPDDNDEIQGIPIYGDTMICIKRNTIRKIRVTTATSGSDPASWFASDVISEIGAAAKWSIVETPFGIFFLAWDHWNLFDGTRTTEIIDEFDTNEILPADYRNVVCHWHDGIFYAAYTDETPGSNFKDKLMVYNWRRKAMDVDTVNVESFASFSGGDDTNELFYGASNLGHVYQADRADKVIKYKKKSTFDAALSVTGTDDICVTGTEDSPIIEIGRDHTIDEMDHTTNPSFFSPSTSSDIDNIIGTINMFDTDGTLVFPAAQLSVGTFGRLFWGLDEFDSLDTVYGYVRTGATQVACEAAAWDGPYTSAAGSNITATPNAWVQIKFEFTANSTAGSPRLYVAEDFVVKMTYARGGDDAEASVEFIHQVGFRNFNKSAVDKIFKKIVSNHEGEQGGFEIRWKTEKASGVFTISLNTNPSMWESFFPSNAFGRKLDITIYKNDLEDLKIKEFYGLYTPEPIIV